MAAARILDMVRTDTGYGFNLTNIDGHNIFRKIEADGPAEKAGALIGDIILKVNDQDMTGKGHSDLVAAIKASGASVRLTVRQLGGGPGKAPAGAAPTRTLTTPAAAAAAAAAAPPPPPSSEPPGAPGAVLIEIVKGAAGFGFNLTTNKEEEHIFRVVDPGGPAQLAGAHPNDVILSVNDTPTAGLTHAQVVGIIKQSTTSVKMRLRLAPTAAPITVPGTTLWSAVHDEAERQLGANRERHDSIMAATDKMAESIAEARRRAEETLRQERIAAEAQRVEAEKARRKAVFEEEMPIILQSIEDMKKSSNELRESILRQKADVEKIATKAEMAEIDKLLEIVEKQMVDELNSKQDALPQAVAGESDEQIWDRELAEKRWMREVAVMQNQLAVTRSRELSALKGLAQERRAAEKRKADEDFERTKAARERDLAMLKGKQERVDSMLAQAQAQRQAEAEAEASKRAAEAEERRVAASERTARAEAMKAQWASEAAARKKQDEVKQQREEEERAWRVKEEQLRAAIEQEKEAARRAAAEEAEEEARRAAARASTGLRSAAGAAGPSSGAGLQHPMIALMAKQKEMGISLNTRL